jgi:beta-mannosidase
MLILRIIMYLTCLASVTFSLGIEQLSLNGRWTVKDFDFGMGMWKPTFRILLVQPPPDPIHLTKDGIPVQIPGCVRQALMQAGIIPDPYIEEQAKQSLWIEEKEWWFVRHFQIHESWQDKLVSLECNMINYRADVWINQIWCGVTEGNYLRLKMDVEQALKYGSDNIITIRMRSIPNSKAAIPDPLFTKGRYDTSLMYRSWVTPTNPQVGEYLISSCLFGWDWGTHMVPIGILQPIKLVARDKLQLEAPFMVTQNLTAEKNAHMRFSVKVHNRFKETSSGEIDLKLFKKGTKEIIWQKSWPVELDGKGSIDISESFLLKNPELWWPIPMGKQPLYKMVVTLKYLDGKISDRVVDYFGIRTLQKVANEDPHWLDGVKIHENEFVDGEYNWTFTINGEKVFTQGANWIPIDALLDTHPERYRYTLRLLAEAGVNMLRVWGEGLYETDDFYHFCDSLGIMVWQDFWIGSYAAAQSQDNSWKAVVTNILRTRNHPSLVLYCGGNEFDASRADRKAQLEKLTELCQIYDGTREYHKASPYGGDEHGGMGIITKDKRRHTYWRYISEGGYYQVWPPRSDMLKFMPEEHLFPIVDNEDRLAYRSLKLIRDPKKNDKLYGIAGNLDELIHIESLRGVIGWQAQLENTKLEKYKVSGCLFWGSNDIWPLASDHMIFYYGTAKPNYYAFKKAGLPLQVTASQQHSVLIPGEPYDLEICIINDYLKSKENLKVRASIYLGQKGIPVYTKKWTGTVAANRSICIGELNWTIPIDSEEHNFLLRLELFDAKDKFLARNEYTCMIGNNSRESVSGGFFGEYHNWEKNQINPDIKSFPKELKVRQEKSFTITYENSTDHVVMGLETLITNLPKGVRFYLSDNYIHLLPGERRILDASLEITERFQSSENIELTIQTDGWNVKKQSKNRNVNLSN